MEDTRTTDLALKRELSTVSSIKPVDNLPEKEVKMSTDEFANYLASHLNLKMFGCVSKFKSIKRALKRGHMSPYGEIYPRRPFNNRANTSNRSGKHSRSINKIKKQIYGELKYKRAV